MDSFVSSFTTMLVALAAVLALAWFALRLLRGRIEGRRGGGNVAGTTSDEALRFVRALPVGSRERVVIVEHRGERWMLGVTAGGISTIAHWGASGTTLTADRPDCPATSQAHLMQTIDDAQDTQ